MAEQTKKYKHLELPLVPEVFLRKKKHGGFGYAKTERDSTLFYETEVKRLSGIATNYLKDKEKYKKYFQPKLIFKVRINEKQNVTDERFREDLKRAGMVTISSAPDKKGFWVAFTDDEKFSLFKKMLSRTTKDKATFIDAIDDINEIPKEEKLGELLHQEPLDRSESAYIDLEIWRMPDAELDQFLEGSEKIITEKGGRVTDTFTTDNFCLRRVVVNKSLLDELLGMREVAHADRPPRVKIESLLTTTLPELQVQGPPPEGAPEVLVVDSGISHHPLLQNAIDMEIALATRNGEIMDSNTTDDAGHGTMVAGIALYRDIESCINKKEFKQEIKLHSAKVMYRDVWGRAVFNQEELAEKQLSKAVTQVIEKHPKCKIVNLSFGNSANRMFMGQRQFSLASQIDELAFKHGLIFTVSAGNIQDGIVDPSDYPNYLLGNTSMTKIIDPSSSAHAITVGSIYKSSNVTQLDFPSPFTRVGPGLRNMIKPELVEYGGALGNEVVMINPNWIPDGRLFTLNKGTSFSAPAVAHELAKIINDYPQISTNMVKALLLSTAKMPVERPGILSKSGLFGTTKSASNLLNVYGYGKPSLERALSSEDNRVLLIYDGEIALNKVNFFTVSLPESFIKERGERSISVTLTFDPPINRNRLDYLGVAMEAHLFKNKDLNETEKAYSQSQIEETETEAVPISLKV